MKIKKMGTCFIQKCLKIAQRVSKHSPKDKTIILTVVYILHLQAQKN